MSRKQQVLKFIKTIRDSFDDAVKVYTSGSCYKFYLILKEVFPESECYYNTNHAITKIGDSYYDITGETEITNHFLVSEENPYPRVLELKYNGRV